MAKSQLLLVAALFAGLSMGHASANAWYPEACKTVDHCGTVESVALVTPADEGESRLIVTSGKVSAVVQRNFLVRESGDGRLHVCMRYDPFGDLEVTCLLVPLRGF